MSENNALLFPGRQFWLRRGKNEKWVFFDCVDDAVDDVFTKVAGVADRLGIISQISKFHPRAEEEDEEIVILNTEVKLVLWVSYTFQKPLEKIEKFKLFAFLRSSRIQQIFHKSELAEIFILSFDQREKMLFE